MSRMAPVEVVQSIYQAFGRGDIPAIMSLLAEDVDWIFYGPEELPFAGHYTGRDEMLRFFSAVGESAEIHAFEPREFIVADSRVVVLGWERVTARQTGRTWETHWAHVFTVEEGQVTYLREYYDTAALVAAFEA